MNVAFYLTRTPIKGPSSRSGLSASASANRFRTSAVSHLSYELSPLSASSLFDRSGDLNESVPSTSGRSPSAVSYVQFPARQATEPGSQTPIPLVRVRLNVHYRVHSRQMLCVGGSQLPFGWSFLSIAKVPLAWNPGDVWSAEVISHRMKSNCCIATHESRICDESRICKDQ